jgi:hypothetical protein
MLKARPPKSRRLWLPLINEVFKWSPCQLWLYQPPQPVAYLWQRTPMSCTTYTPACRRFSHFRCCQVTSVCTYCCGNHRTPASWIEVTAIFVQTNAEERALQLRLFPIYLLATVLFTATNVLLLLQSLSHWMLSPCYFVHYTPRRKQFQKKSLDLDELCSWYFVLHNSI